METLRFYFIRHARPLVPKGYAYGGMENVPINMTGPKTKAAIKAIADTLPAQFHAVSSPSPRALLATKAVLDLKGTNSNAIELNEKFLEQNWGDWQGKMYNDIPADQLAHYHADEDTRSPPGGESLNQLLKRVSEGMHDLTASYRNGEIGQNHILVGCHGGVIRAALAHAEQKPVSAMLKQPIRRLSLSIIDYSPDEKRFSVAERNLCLD